ncbi:MAG: hypothetical protein C0481_10335 [Phenylobacterium sp.]|uniref:hypothetical protein n=1 Tax=Phenylobacterium sp. TaxID=1871053 RepID=UPI0025E94D58|nr:hypothetical protein [Phenylobacterium sp.]MBA4012251.1 hypothetical protein [Phenylobacterium sp.]
MTYPETPLDKLSVELQADAEAYAAKVDGLARDPYFREAAVKVSVSGFVWALFHQFKDDPFARDALREELKMQGAAIERALGASAVSGVVQ